MLRALALPDFAQKVPGFESVRNAAGARYNELALEGLLDANGRVRIKGGCRECQSRKLLRKFKGVYREFVHRIVELSRSDADKLRALKEYFKAECLVVQDPDTRAVYRF